MTSYFITGTDTGVGKTLVTSALLYRLQQMNIRSIGMKPVAAGCEPDGTNEDVQSLLAACGIPPDDPVRPSVNPYCFSEAIAPHLAACHAGVEIQKDVILSAFGELNRHYPVVLVEGVGGFKVPFSQNFDSADLAQSLALPVILVVGMRLGCLNHALLTQEAISQRGLKLAAWVANVIDPDMSCLDENIATLEALMPAPCLGTLPWLAETATERVPAQSAHLKPDLLLDLPLVSR